MVIFRNIILFFKHIAAIDVLSIAFGFMLRLLAGVYVFGNLPTSWAVLCVLSGIVSGDCQAASGNAQLGPAKYFATTGA